jgi:hypothetical protein
VSRHDPADLREAAQNTRFAERAAQYKSKLADRLEAWADLAPLEAAVLDAAKGAIGSYPRSPAQKKLNEALRTLKEAIDG